MDHDESAYRSSEDEDYVPDINLQETSVEQVEREDIDNVDEDDISTSKREKIDKLWNELNESSSKISKKKRKNKKKEVLEFKMPIMGVNPRAKKRIKKQPVVKKDVEVVKFAGVEYNVRAKEQKESSLDQLVSMTNDGPKKITAMEKTSYDWEEYKKQKGITDELKHATKDGYLEKQNFWSRVDVRTHQALYNEQANRNTR